MCVFKRLPVLLSDLMTLHFHLCYQRYTFTFLVTSRLFLKPFELLQMIADCPELDDVAAIQLLRTWKDTCASDFKDQRMMKPFTEATKKLTSANAKSATLVRTLQEGLFKALTDMETYVNENILYIYTNPSQDGGRFIPQVNGWHLIFYSPNCSLRSKRCGECIPKHAI